MPHLAGNKYAVSWCRGLLPAVKAIVTVCYPVTYALTAIVYLLARLFGIDPHLLEDEVTEDEIISMVNEGHEQGVLDEHEAEMIQNIFELNDKEAQDVMTHRKNIVAINGCLNLSDSPGDLYSGDQKLGPAVSQYAGSEAPDGDRGGRVWRDGRPGDHGRYSGRDCRKYPG